MRRHPKSFSNYEKAFNLSGNEAKRVMEWLTDAYPCNGGAFFWVISDDTDAGTWSSQVNEEAINGGEWCEFPFNESILWIGCASACGLVWNNAGCAWEACGVTVMTGAQSFRYTSWLLL